MGPASHPVQNYYVTYKDGAAITGIINLMQGLEHDFYIFETDHNGFVPPKAQ